MAKKDGGESRYVKTLAIAEQLKISERKIMPGGTGEHVRGDWKRNWITWGGQGVRKNPQNLCPKGQKKKDQEGDQRHNQQNKGGARPGETGSDWHLLLHPGKGCRGERESSLSTETAGGDS